MTLREAIEHVLKDKGKPMTIQEIADELNKNGLYHKSNGEQITASNVSMRAKNHLDLFNITISLVGK